MLNNKELYDKSFWLKGGVLVVTDGDKYYWAKEQDYFSPEWEEIPKYLYDSLIQFEEECKDLT